MKKIIIIGIGILIVIACTVYFLQDTDEKAPPVEPSASFPGDTQDDDEDTAARDMSIKTADGRNLRTANFLADEKTVADTHNPGFYYLGNHFSEQEEGGIQPSYVITYIESTDFFNIGIYKEPLGTVRKEAEIFLKNTLGITQEEMCSLNYQVSTTAHANEYYGGTSLGFSFCPGSIAL